MSEEVNVTLVIMIPDGSGTFRSEEFSDVIVNARASAKRIKQEILQEFPDLNLGVDDADLMMLAPDGSTLSDVKIQEGSRLILIPKVTGKAIKIRRKP
jgi:hypothetical protein